MKNLRFFSNPRYAPTGMAIVILLLLIACKSNKGFLAEEKQQAKAYNKIIETSKIKSNIVFDWGIPRFASMMIPSRQSRGSDPVESAFNFIEDNKSFFRIDDPSKSFFLKRIQEDSLFSHIFLGQIIDNIPVFAGELSIHFVGKNVFQTNGMYIPKFKLNEYPRVAKITAKEAYRIAHKEDSCVNSLIITDPKLYYFNPRLIMNESEMKVNELGDKTYLVYKVNITSCEYGGKAIFVDATNGEKIFTINTSPNSGPNKDFHIKSAVKCRNWGTACGWPGAKDWFNEHGAFPGASPDAEGYSALNNLHKIYDYYYNKFHRHGWDGHDGTIWITLDADDCKDLDGNSMAGNAHFYSDCNDFVFANNMSTLDIMAHEITHGVTRNTAGLHDSYQPGALDESYSDVFGMLIDDDGDRFTIGEGSAGRERKMDFPIIDHIKKYVILPNTYAGDYGGVHLNLGITNKAAYLIFNGGNHDNFNIKGIGERKTAQLYYFVLTSLLTSNSNFSDVANSTLAAANIFSNGINPYLQPGLYGFNNNDVCSVRNAFASVGLLVPDRDCDGIIDTIDPFVDQDHDGVADEKDNCIYIANPGQNDDDGDRIGNICDDDIDGDKILNKKDNCPYKYNWDQLDKDGDGYGDICTDSDNDGIVDLYDNCRSTRNPDQSDIDGDKKGDVCDFDDLDGDGIPNIADNCPNTPNRGQLNSDGDQIGDECDNCPTVPDPGMIISAGDGIRWLVYYISQEDTDNDHIGNVCDDDDDDDTIKDDEDNCPLDWNKYQEDGDGDGIGRACDNNEPFDFSFWNDFFEKTIVVDLPKLDKTIPGFPLPGPQCRTCPIYLPSSYFFNINIEMQEKHSVVVIDDEGLVVLKSGASNSHSLKLFPTPDAYFQYKAGVTSRKNYRIIILQPEDRSNPDLLKEKIRINCSLSKLQNF